ncbi:MAG: hypothetical protein ACLP5H_17710, partial [Desulfomonilaceae bacterium]
TASSRNSLEYRPWGILALSIVTPPSHLSIKHWCPSFSTYPKFRRIFRCKTIYYSNGMVERGTLLPGYLIEEVREQGQPQPTRFFYDFDITLFPADATKRVEMILDYLTDDSSKKNPRVFKRSILPRAGCKTIKQAAAVAK